MKKNIFTKNKGKTFLLFTIFAFIIGFTLGWQSNNSDMSELEIELENLNLDLRSFNEYLTFAEIFELDSCESSFIEYLGRRIYESGVTLENMEQAGKTDTFEYDLLKQKHNINQVTYYSELKRFKDNCGYQKNIILFFFDGENPEESRQQGRVIGKVNQQKDISLLPMDYGYTKQIGFFYDYYKISELPALIINYETILQGFTDEETLLNLLN